MAEQYYLAYGSNLHPLRLQARARSAKAVARVRMSGQRLAFNKRSKYGSGKCNLMDDKSSVAYGVLYEIDASDMNALHKAEGPGYLAQKIELRSNENTCVALVYIATHDNIVSNLAPYDWYKDLVVLGAEFFGFPDDYLARLRATPSISDSDSDQAQSHRLLISRIRQYPALGDAPPWLHQPFELSRAR